MSELDKTIEELEAEVLAELEEASEKPLGKAKDLGLGSDNADEGVSKAKDPKANVAGADKADKVEGEKAKDGGAAVVSPDAKSSSTDVAVKSAKSVSGDAQQKSAGKADAPQKLAAGDEVEHDGEELEENKKMTKAQALEQIGKMKKSDIEEMLADRAAKLDEAKNYEIKNGKIHISKANFRKVHKDFKNSTKGKERMVALDPKSGATTSYEVVFEEVELDEWTLSDVEAAMRKRHGKVDKEAIEKLRKVMYKGNVDRNDLVKVGYGKLHVESVELDEVDLQKAEIDERIKSISVKEDMEVLMGADDSLTEEFKLKAATIFEAAVKSKIRSEIERIDEQVRSEKTSELETFKKDLAEKVDTYLNYVVEEWTKENELAIERGLKGEIAEDFISGLKQLFEDHYIDVPDEKYDVLEAQSEKISQLEEKLNDAIQKSVDLTSSNNKLVREQVISEVSEDLADTEIEKFKSLTQDVEFGSEEDFRVKLDTLKESYFPKTQPLSTSEETFGDEDGSTAKDVDTTDAMKTYMSAISRNQKASA